MELNVMMPQMVNAKSVHVHVKVVDTGNYELRDHLERKIASRDEDYVPGFFPGDHYGDYLILDIDIETGQIRNWKKPTPQAVVEAFRLSGETD